MEALPRVPSSGAGLAVLNCYDQLRREIQALLTENEELQRVVALIRENQQLRHAIRSRPELPPSLAPMFMSTPRPNGRPANFRSSDPNWMPVPMDQDTSGFSSPLRSVGRLGDHGLSGNYPMSWRRTFTVQSPMDPNRDDGWHRFSCPLDRFTSMGQPADGPGAAAAPPPDAPLDPQDLAQGPPQSPPHTPPGDLSPPGAYYISPVAGEQPEAQGSLPGLPLSPIPLPSAQAPPDTPLPDHSTPLLQTQPQPQPQRPPDVRPKEPRGRIGRSAERPASIRESARSGGQRDPRQQMWERIVGEIAFQLDRRILSTVFPDRARLYGFTVSSIPDKIMKSAMSNSASGFDEHYCAAAMRRYVNLMNRLRAIGYNPEVHAAFSEAVVNAYGILRERPELAGPDARSYNSPGFLRRVVMETVPFETQADVLLLLECLHELAQDDGKPMFIW